MKKRSLLLCVCLSFLQTGLGVFIGFLCLTLFFGNSQSNLNAYIFDVLVKSLIVWLSILIGWFIGNRNEKKNRIELNSSSQVASNSRISRNMMISNLITSSSFCLLMWLLSFFPPIVTREKKEQNILLIVMILSIAISIVMAVFYFRSYNKDDN